MRDKLKIRFGCVLFGALFLVVLNFVSLVGTPVSAQDTVRVATIERQPFSFLRDDEWNGFSIQLWEKVSTTLNLKTEFVEFEMFSDMLASVENGDTDMALANISVTAQREKVLDFSRPFFDSGLLILAPVDAPPSLWSALWNRSLWLAVLSAIVLFVVAAIGIAFFERRHEHFQNRNARSSFDEGFWWAVSVVTNASFTIFTPMSAAGRLLAYALIIVGLFVVSTFVATITASLTVQELRGQVSGVNDLRNKRVGTTEGSTSSNFLTSQSIRHKTFADIQSMFAELKSGDLDAVVHDAPILAYFAATQGEGKFQTVGRLFNPEKYAIALPQNSPLTEAINQEILRLRESGEFEQLVTDWFGPTYQ